MRMTCARPEPWSAADSTTNRATGGCTHSVGEIGDEIFNVEVADFDLVIQPDTDGWLVVAGR